jgi:hypothetical protein
MGSDGKDALIQSALAPDCRCQHVHDDWGGTGYLGTYLTHPPRKQRLTTTTTEHQRASAPTICTQENSQQQESNVRT